MPGRVTELTETQIVADLLHASRRQGRTLTEIQIPQPAKDTFTVAATPATTYTLTAIPYQGTGGSSLNLSLNGLELLEGTDYTVDYTTAIVTVSATLKGTPTPADVLTADYWTTGDLIAASGPVDTGGPVLNAQGSAVGTGSTSYNLTLGASTQAGDTVVVFAWTNAGTPANVTFAGLGGTWTKQANGPFIRGVATSCTAGQTVITLSYPFAFDVTALAGDWTNAGASPGGAGVGYQERAVGPTTLDAVTGSTVSPVAGQLVIIGWELDPTATGATTSFTDTNGTYSQLTPVSGNGAIVEMGWTQLPATGATNHVGSRGDAAAGSGAIYLFGP